MNGGYRCGLAQRRDPFESLGLHKLFGGDCRYRADPAEWRVVYSHGHVLSDIRPHWSK